jgi:hypothetical protein
MNSAAAPTAAAHPPAARPPNVPLQRAHIPPRWAFSAHVPRLTLRRAPTHCRFGIGGPRDVTTSDESSSSGSDSELEDEDDDGDERLPNRMAGGAQLPAASIGRAVANHTFGGQLSGELDIIEGQTVQLLATEGEGLPEGFWRGRLANGEVGRFPKNFVDQVELWPSVEPPPPPGSSSSSSSSSSAMRRRRRSAAVAAAAAPTLGAAFYCCCAAHWVSLMLGFQAEYLIWQARFPGDFAAQARVMGTVMSAGGVLSFVLNPIMVRETPLFISHLCTKRSILPRQARDKHRET